jgi:threonine synthase
VGEELKRSLAQYFSAGFCDDAATVAAIKKMWDKHGYLIDTHTAVAFHVLEQYRGQTGTTPRRGGFHRKSLQILRQRLGALGVTE